MLIVQDTLVSDDVVERQFVCNLDACKGACCIDGEYGAPLEAAELPILESILKTVWPYLEEDNKASIEAQGAWIMDEEYGGYTTPLRSDRACVYVVVDRNGIAKCGIEEAWADGLIPFRKPISCHLYPVRIQHNEHTGFDLLNYDRWDICNAACKHGEALKVPVYQFVKDALVRKYGEAWYEELDAAARHLQNP